MPPREITVAVAANFTADMVLPPVEQLLALAGVPHRVVLAGYHQLFASLVDRAGAFAGAGVAVALVRLADLGRRAHGAAPVDAEALRRGVRELGGYVAGHAARAGAAPLLVVIAPEPKALLADAAHAALAKEMEATLAAEVRAAGAQCVTSEELLSLYPLAAWDDAAADELGHIPYTGEAFAALGAVVARKVRARVAEPHKVLVLDADNTLWTGVVGEDGADGVVVDAGREALQRFALAQREAGMLLAICSKNAAEDVEEVFRKRRMPLAREHFAGVRVNWQPKSENLRALAAELSLGLSSFVFVDDSLVECAEVRAHCPEVLTVHVPQSSTAATELVSRLWAFDRWQVTAEDRARADQYQKNAERSRAAREAPSMAEFLASLGLAVEVEPPSPADLPRVSQLTFRTNQFNLTTVRRTEAEIAASGLEALKVQVRDRFGDHGLVGMMLFDPREDALAVDTFLLSCRVLQRGVEHRMVARLGEIARERGLARVELPFARTAKNQPAELFLKSLGGAVEEREGGFVVRLPAEEAAALAYVPAEGAAELVADDAPKAPKGEGATRSPEALETIARELGTAAAIHARVAPAARKARPALAAPPLAPRDAREREVAAICEDALGVAPVGVRDDLFLELGADSFAAVRIAAGMREKLGLPVQVVTVQETRTVERLCEATAPRAQVTPSGPTKALHALRREGTKPALFLGRPATRSGGGLSYVALARAIDPDRPVYVFQNRPLLDGTAPYPSIEEMAREYREAIREVQPKGPYLLAGWCLGGKTALEMAHLLTRGGDRVSRLVLFDTPAPSSLRERAAFLAKREVTRAELRAFARFPRLQRVLPWIKIARSRSLLQRFGVLAYYEHDNDDLRLIAYAFPGLFDLGALAALPAAARWQRVYETLAAGEAGGAAPENVDAAAVRRGYHYFAWDHRLDAMYRPAFTYAGRVSMINVRGAPYPAAWRRYLAHDPEVVEIDAKGNKTAPDAHSAMMSEENVKLFGPVLARMLEETA